MRRFVTLSILLLSSIPFGVSISGCSHNLAPVFCNGGDSGMTTTQASTITLTPIVYGISLNYAEIGQMNTPSATDCKGSSAFVQSYTYGTTDMTIADVQPNTGRICAGTWNRNSGGGIPDYTYCNPTNKSGTAYISASADGVTSNPIAIYVHPVVTSVVMGGSPLGSCLTDPTTLCALDATQANGCSTQNSISAFSIASNVVTFQAPNSLTAGESVTISGLTVGTYLNGQSLTVLSAGLSSTQFEAAFTHPNVALTADPGLVTIVGSTPPIYTGTSCLSQGRTAQLVSRVYASVAGVNPFTGLTAAGSNLVTSVSSIAGLATGQTITSSAFPPGTTIKAIGSTAPYTVTASANATATNTTPVEFIVQTNISCLAGHLQYGVQGESSLTTVSPVVSIDQNGVATAAQPGSVLITANVSNAASSAGFYSTCPPATIALSVPGTTTSPVTLDANNTQSLSAVVTDVNNVVLSGLTLEYESTSPTTIPASSTGTVTPTYAGSTSISALCQPPQCNSSPLNQIGLFGNGVPVVSNSVQFNTPGTNSTVLYMASSQSLLIKQVDFTTGVVGSPFQLPWVPNSMVISNDGFSIYMGSSSGLMVLTSSSTLSLSRSDPTSPGTVLAISPDGSTIVISDPVKQTITVESSSGNVVSTYGGVGTRAQFTPDSGTLYITAGNQLLAYSSLTGWTNITPSSPSPETLKYYPVTDVAITVPSVGAYFAGTHTTARSYCPASTPSSQFGVIAESNLFYPQADDQAVVTDRIAATNDGQHIIGATATVTPASLTDIQIKSLDQTGTGACTALNPALTTTSTTTGLTFASSPLAPRPLSSVTATAITGVVPSPDSSVAFVTYTGSGGVLPAYTPSSIGAGTLASIKLSSGTAPITGVFSADSSTFYVGTSGDNLVHIINRSTLTDSSTLAPKLTSPSGTAVPVDLLVQKPRKTT
jgi:hypothetical protein